MVYLYGVTDASALENFTEGSGTQATPGTDGLVWNDSAAFDTAYTYEINDTAGYFYDADGGVANEQPVAGFVIGSNDVAGTTYNVSSAAMTAFANASANPYLTFVMVRDAGPESHLNLTWATKEHATLAAPTLSRQSGGTSYASWISDYVTGADTNYNADVEYGGIGDGLDNLMEYALGGNPTNDDAAAVSPGFYLAEAGGTNWFYYVHNERTTDPTLTYTVGATTNLVTTVADTNEVEWVGESVETNGFKTVTNRTEAATDARFIKLEVTE
jgi:hypothetical protein